MEAEESFVPDSPEKVPYETSDLENADDSGGMTDEIVKSDNKPIDELNEKDVSKESIVPNENEEVTEESAMPDENEEEKAEENEEAKEDENDEKKGAENEEEKVDEIEEAKGDEKGAENEEEKADEIEEAKGDENEEEKGAENEEEKGDENEEANADETEEAKDDKTEESKADENEEAKANENEEAKADGTEEAKTDENEVAKGAENKEASADENEEAKAESVIPDENEEATKESTTPDNKKDSTEDVAIPSEENLVHASLTEDTPVKMVSIGSHPHPTMETSATGTDFRDNLIATNGASVSTEQSVTVKLILLPSGQVITKSMALETKCIDIKQSLSSEIKIPVEFVQVLFNGTPIADDKFSLDDLGIEVNGTVGFEISSSDPENHPIKSSIASESLDMPDVITVKIPFDDGQVKQAIVEVERVRNAKRFIGGYRHKKTGKEYHHATCQTYGPVRPPPTTERHSRDTQTVEQQHSTQQTFNTTATQMTKPGVFVSNITDKYIVPSKYETADQYEARMLGRVIIMQKYYRRWLAKRYVNTLRSKRDACLKYEEELEIKKRKEKEERIQREFQRRMNPKSKEDFDLLYGALEKWRQEEMTRINTMLSGAERKAALCLLLEQETELIAAIDRHQLDASKDSKNKSIQQLLGMAASPKKWKSNEGHNLQMDTAYTLRGKELLDIYNSLNMKYLTQDERLDVLLTLKHTVKEHDCRLTQEIINLIDREADLLMRGAKEDNLTGLRKRISTLFLQYCKTPTFNPEITHLLHVPQDPSVLRKDIHFCNSCNRYLQATAFNLGIKSTGMGRCRACLRKDNMARTRQDLSAYKHLLQKLRKTEENYNDGARIAFLIEEADLRYLVENTWESMSVLSGWNDMADLEMVRWDTKEEWTPWNCIYLTRDESEAHYKLTNLVDAYGDMMIHHVRQKHVLARNHFSQLRLMADKMQAEKLHLENARLENAVTDK